MSALDESDSPDSCRPALVTAKLARALVGMISATPTPIEAYAGHLLNVDGGPSLTNWFNAAAEMLTVGAGRCSKV
jgi:hypothetical protein